MLSQDKYQPIRRDQTHRPTKTSTSDPPTKTFQIHPPPITPEKDPRPPLSKRKEPASGKTRTNGINAGSAFGTKWACSTKFKSSWGRSPVLSLWSHSSSSRNGSMQLVKPSWTEASPSSRIPTWQNSVAWMHNAEAIKSLNSPPNAVQ